MNDNIFHIFPNETFMDLTMIQFGREKCVPSHSFGPAKRNHYLFHYVLSGSGMLMAENSAGTIHTYHIDEDRGFMIFPNQTTTYVADSDEPWEYIWIEFYGLRSKAIVDATGLSPDRPVYNSRSGELGKNMKNEMLYIIENRNMPPLNLIGHLYLFLDLLMRSAPKPSVPKGSKLRDFYIHEALAYIEDNYGNSISIEDIAAACGLNRSYFGKIFKDVIGKNPQEFLLNYRMIKATELLKHSRLSIGDISFAVGYDNQLHFSRAFKKLYGLSPRNWRNENRIGI